MTVENGSAVSLKDYFDGLREADGNAVKAAVESLNKRLDSMNEFRTALKDQQATFALKETVDVEITSLKAKIEALTLTDTAQVARGDGLSSAWAYGLGGGMFLLGVVTLGIALLKP